MMFHHHFHIWQSSGKPDMPKVPKIRSLHIFAISQGKREGLH